jgi:hypothetical protein
MNEEIVLMGYKQNKDADILTLSNRGNSHFDKSARGNLFLQKT